MKFYFKLSVTGFLLFIAGFLLFVRGGASLSVPADYFNFLWDNGIEPVCYSGGDVVNCNCTEGNAVRGCVREARQSTGSFLNSGDVEVRKLVWPTDVTGVYDVSIGVRGRNSSGNNNACYVVLFDTSASMQECNFDAEHDATNPDYCLWDGDFHYKTGDDAFGDKWYNAVDGAISFSQVVVNSNARLGLVFFGRIGKIQKGFDSGAFDTDDFPTTAVGGSTNLQHGLMKVEELFDTAVDCEAKIVVLMSDGVPTCYWDDAAGQEKCYSAAWSTTIQKAETQATLLKSGGVMIYAIGYEMYGSGADVLRNVATTGNYYDANVSNISDVFQSIGSRQLEFNAGEFIDVEDQLGDNIVSISGHVWANSGDAITETGLIVYTSQIKIKNPELSGFHNSNSGLVLRYRDLSGDVQSLNISPNDTAQIYWDLPECSGTEPSGAAVIKGNNKFTQSWNGLLLDPEIKEWSYTGSSTPGECEWTCSGGYVKSGSTCVVQKVKVTFDPNGGTPTPPPANVDSGEKVDEPEDPILTGYHLTGWTRTCNGDDFFNFGTDVVTSDITLCAKWEPNTYQVEFDKNGGNGTMGNQIFTYGTPQDLNPNLYTKEGSSFVRWNTNPDGSGTGYDDKQSVNNLVATGKIILYAQWSTNTYTIVFSGNGGKGTMANQTLSYDETKALNANSFTKTGYHFSGWNTRFDNTGTGYKDKATVKNLVNSGTVTLYAQWEPNTYTIVFSGNNATSGITPNLSLEYDATGILPDNGYGKIGYQFSGWNTNPDGTGTGYKNKAEVKNLVTTGTVTLYAQWVPNNYQIKFNANGGNGTMANQTLRYGTPDKLISNQFVREGFTFVGWNTLSGGNGGTGYADQEQVLNLATTGVVNLYAQWSTNTYQIEFNKNGGDGTMTNQIMSYGSSLPLKENEFTKNGYHFVKWTRNSDGSGTGYENRAEVMNLATTGIVKLYAQWEPNTYTIVFSGNSATSGTTPDLLLDYDTTGTLSPNGYGKIGYQFSGWNTNPDGTGTGYKDKAEVKNLATTGTVTLYAQWMPSNYTIIFDGNGASAGTMSGMNMVYDQEKALTMNSYSRNGYNYLGWNTQADGKGTSYTDGQVVKNLATEGEVRLYAQWKKLGSSGSGGPGCKKDDCPDGDYSGDPCDKECGRPPVVIPEKEPEPEPTPGPVPNPVVIKKCSIEGSTHSREVNEAYIWACQRGIIKSKTITGARLGEYLNRAEMAKITTIFEMIVLGNKPNRNKDCSAFADSISDYGKQMKDYMVTSCQLERMGIHTADYEPIIDFMPRKFVSRAEFGTILSRILWEDKYEASKNSSYYYVDHLNRLKSNGILTNINPNLVERRSYAILMIYRAAKMMGKL